MLIIFFFISYIIFCFWRLDFGVMFLIFALPFYLIRFHILGLPSTVLEGMILIAFAIFFIKSYKQIIKNFKFRIHSKFRIKNLKLIKYPFNIEIILLLIISWLAIFIAGSTSASFGIWKAYFFEPILVYILIFNAFKQNTNLQIIHKGKIETINLNFIEKILWPLTLSAFFISLWAILQKLGILFSPLNFLPRITGPFLYPNALGLYLGPLILLMIGWAFYKIKNTRNKIQKIKYKIFELLFLGLSIILSLLAIYFAQSEGALVGVVIGFLFFIGFIICKNFFKQTIVLRLGMIKIFVIMILAFIYPFIALNIYSQNYYPHFTNKYVNYVLNKIMLKDLSGEIRKQQWRETWQMLSSSVQRFIFGAGLDGYQKAIMPYHQAGIFYNFSHDSDFRRKLVLFNKKYKSEHWQPTEIYMYPHSIFLNFWSELGLAGALLFVWLIFKSVRYLLLNIRQGDYITIGILGAIIVIIIHGIVDVPYFKNDLAIMFWLLLGLIGILNIENKKED